MNINENFERTNERLYALERYLGIRYREKEAVKGYVTEQEYRNEWYGIEKVSPKKSTKRKKAKKAKK